MARPLKFSTPEELETKVNEYFNTAPKPTLSGLAVFLDVERETLYNYKERDGFFDTIKKAQDRMAAIFEERAVYSDKQVAGVIFVMKNMGYKDSQSFEHSGEVNTTGFDYSKLSNAALKELANASGSSE